MKNHLIAIVLLFIGLTGFSQKIVFLDEATFKSKVWNYEPNSTWNFIGDKPMIIDFYADWCQPCKMIAPHLAAIQAEYGNKLQVYKINTDVTPALANLFKIRSIPTLLFIPANGDYKQIVGYRSQEQFEQLVSSILKVEK